ncbi:hypothetical protein PIB30_077304 [Stylosanthes scabra]|uniref:Uncharacterized protein n=1 Tax=Stylosanthes scabra TaxID=79078 RepID=A0ABU6VT64_9FABA|nr:hypothetical protein [Stylosanthes scabra]
MRCSQFIKAKCNMERQNMYMQQLLVDNITNHSIRGMESQGEAYFTNQPSPNRREGGEQNQDHAIEGLNNPPKLLDHQDAFGNIKHNNDNMYNANLWSYRDRTRMTRTFYDKGRKTFQKATSITLYIVEFPGDDEVMQDTTRAPVIEGTWEMELIQKISHCLQIKRKREDSGKMKKGSLRSKERSFEAFLPRVTRIGGIHKLPDQA